MPVLWIKIEEWVIWKMFNNVSLNNKERRMRAKFKSESEIDSGLRDFLHIRQYIAIHWPGQRLIDL